MNHLQDRLFVRYYYISPARLLGISPDEFRLRLIARAAPINLLAPIKIDYTIFLFINKMM